MFVLVEIKVFMLVVTLLKSLYYLISISKLVAMCLLSIDGLYAMMSSQFCMSWHMIGHTEFKILARIICEAPYFYLMHCITMVSRFVFDECIAKGGEIAHNV